jgi:hypothetical protein
VLRDFNKVSSRLAKIWMGVNLESASATAVTRGRKT